MNNGSVCDARRPPPAGWPPDLERVVADAHQHHGLATLLLDTLALAAWERGIMTFTADTLAENRAMLKVFLDSGFAVSTDHELEALRLRLPIAPTPAYRVALAEREATRRPGSVGDRSRC
jgi:GNAT superfamily N-acetyltransferase